MADPVSVSSALCSGAVPRRWRRTARPVALLAVLGGVVLALAVLGPARASTPPAAWPGTSSDVTRDRRHAGPAALAVTKILTLTAPVDTYVDSNHPGESFASRTYLLAGSYDDLSDAYALIRFPLKTVPEGAVVRQAVLRAYYDSYCGNTSETVTIAQVVAPWDVSTVTWNTRPAIKNTSSSRAFGTSVGAYYAWPPITSLVRQWLDDPKQYPNNGIALRMAAGKPCRHFASANSSHDPQLVLELELPTPAPTSTLRPTLSPTPTATSELSPTPTGSVTAADTATPEPTPAATDTATSTPTVTTAPTATPSPTPTARRASIGGRVWHDANRDGQVDPGEDPMTAATLNLELSDSFIAEATIDGQGRYVFADLEPGRIYRVHLDEATLRPVAYRRTTAANPLVVVPQGGQDIRTADFGYAPPPATEPPERQRIDTWVLGLEVNQGQQDWVFTDLAHAGNLGGFVSLDQTAFANPLIPGKPAVVRVYAGLRDSPDRPATPAEGFAVTGRLYVQRAVVGARRHTLNPVESPDCSEHAGGVGQACRRVVGLFPSLGRQGQDTQSDYDLDLIDARSHWEGTLNFVIPPDVTATFDQAGVILTAEIEPVARQEVQAADNVFELQLGNVAAPNPLNVDLLRIRLRGDPPLPSSPAARRAMDQMVKLMPYDQVVFRRNRTYVDRTFTRKRVQLLDTGVYHLSECDTLWLDLFQTFGNWVVAGDTVFGLTPTDIDLGHCTGLAWRVPGLGGIGFAELPAFAITSTLILDPDDEDKVGIMAQELYHAHLDRRHASNDHGEGDGCFLEGIGLTLVDLLTNYDSDCWKPSLHPHGAMGEYPPGYVRIGPNPGGLTGRIYGDRGAFGMRIEATDDTSWRLTLYDPCPTGALDRADPLGTLAQRWDLAASRYRCTVDDDTMPHTFMSYGDNPWPSEDEFLGVTVPARFAAAEAASKTDANAACHDVGGAHGAASAWPEAGRGATRAECIERGLAVSGLRATDPPGLLATGIISGSLAGFVPLLPSPAGAAWSGPSTMPLKVAARTSDGRTITLPAAVSVSIGHPQRWLQFAATLPAEVEPERLALTLRGQEIAVATASTHAPTVRVLWPNGGERLWLAGSYTVRWTAGDEDGNPLSFLVESSPDGGATWYPLGRAEEQLSLDVRAEAGALDPSGRALIRVTATDGLRWARDASDAPFRVWAGATHLPIAWR